MVLEVCRDGLRTLFFWALTMSWSRLLGSCVKWPSNTIKSPHYHHITCLVAEIRRRPQMCRKLGTQLGQRWGPDTRGQCGHPEVVDPTVQILKADLKERLVGRHRRRHREEEGPPRDPREVLEERPGLRGEDDAKLDEHVSNPLTPIQYIGG
jgi:hypothetical protein